jgi:hypothetical protein
VHCNPNRSRIDQLRDTFYEIVLPLIEGKSVLDVGSIGHSYIGQTAFKTWNFAVIKGHAAKIKGFDLPKLAPDIELARRDGFEIEVGDAETYLTSELYQVVFAGDLIEHLSNPGLFLDCSYRNLTSDGTLIVVTPNTYSLAKIARVLTRLTNEPPVNPEHTFCFTPRTLSELVSRHGFRTARIEYCDFEYASSHGSALKRAMLHINAQLSAAVPHLSQVMVAVCRKIPKP